MTEKGGEDIDTDENDDTLIPPEYPETGISIQAHKIWIGNIDKRITNEQLLKILKPYGKIRSMRYLFATSGRNPKEPRGYAFVEYSTRQEAEQAKANLHGKKALGQKLVVDWAKPDAAPSKTVEATSLTWCASDVSETLASSVSANAKIEALEEKLKLMKQANPQTSSSLKAPDHFPLKKPKAYSSGSPSSYRPALLPHPPYQRPPLLHAQPTRQALLKSPWTHSKRKSPYVVPDRTNKF
jgi:RNA recognition motif-containing protein